MIIGIFVIDLVIPCHFPTEIKKGNQAVGFISAGISVSIGIILRSTLTSPTISSSIPTFLDDIIGTCIYYIIGLIFFIIGYFMLDFFNKEYKLSEEIEKGNVAASISVCGLFIGIALIISGVIA